MSATDTAAIAHFVHKWWLREPEMRIATEFCARADAPPAGAGADGAARSELRFTAWGALLHELREALFEIADAGVGGAKRGWWAEELQLLAAGRARHPLGEALSTFEETRAAPWTGLSLALVGGPSRASCPTGHSGILPIGGAGVGSADAAQAIATLQPLAEAVVAVENAMFQSRGGANAARALAVHWLLQRLPAGLAEEDAARIPMHLLARHGLTVAQLADAPEALLRDWGRELAQALPVRGEGAYIRRARARFDRARGHRLAARGGAGGFDAPAAPGSLWRAWRAARGA